MRSIYLPLKLRVSVDDATALLMEEHGSGRNGKEGDEEAKREG